MLDRVCVAVCVCGCACKCGCVQNSNTAILKMDNGMYFSFVIFFLIFFRGGGGLERASSDRL